MSGGRTGAWHHSDVVRKTTPTGPKRTPEEQAQYMRDHAMGKTFKVAASVIQPGDILWSTLQPTYFRVVRVHQELEGRLVFIREGGGWITCAQPDEEVRRLEGAGAAFLLENWKVT